MRTGTLGIALLISISLLIMSCGDDDGGTPTPVTGVVISPEEDLLEIGNATTIDATVSGGDSKALAWYVNGIENGNTTWGTITQNSPVTYTAPDSMPAQATVTIVAVSVEDDAWADTCSIELKFTKIFVNSGSGDDNTGTGSVNLPVKTITKGLTLADAGMTVLVYPGLYDQYNGEVFELAIPAGVALVGMNWETCIINGHGTGSYNASILMDDPGASFRKFTLEMGEPLDQAWEVAILVRDDDPVVDSIRVFERGNFSVMRVGGTENAVIQDCHFVVNDGYEYYRGFELAGENLNLILRNCTASGFYTGVFVNAMQEPLIEGCALTANNYGVGLWYELPGNNPNPDLGGGARGSAGGNMLGGNTTCGLNNTTTNTVYAKFNTWDNDPPVEGEDYCNTGTGSVVTQ